jgi:hypothetical protein
VDKVAKAVANLSVGTEERSMAKVALPECAVEASTDQEKATEAISINKNNTAKPDNAPTEKPRSWKRINREDAEKKSKCKDGAQPADSVIGMVRSQPCDTELELEPEAKRQNFRVPTLSECLGIEGLRCSEKRRRT